MNNGNVLVIGEMDNSDGTFESANRVYDTEGLCPTIPTCQGGGIQPKVIVEYRKYERKGKDLDMCDEREKS